MLGNLHFFVRKLLGILVVPETAFSQHKNIVWFVPLDLFGALTLEWLPGLVMTNSLLLKMTIEIVDFPIENGGFP